MLEQIAKLWRKKPPPEPLAQEVERETERFNGALEQLTLEVKILTMADMLDDTLQVVEKRKSDQ